MKSLSHAAHLSNANRSPFRALLARITAMDAAFRSRQALRSLDDTMLEDIGMTRSEAEQEASRPVWDVPQHWLR